MLIEALEDRFARKLAGHCQVSDNAFRVVRKDDNGFDVWIREEGRKHFVVGFGDWQEKYTDPTAALACFAQGLSNQCRLIVHARFGKDFRLEVEQWRQGRWVRTGERGPQRFAPWPLGRRRVLQNDWLHEESAAG
jgi:hypothetical protein